MAFRYPAYRQLKRELGEQGAFIELTELALLELQGAVGAHPAGTETAIVEVAQRHGFHLHFRDWPSTLSSVARKYIVEASRVVDEFCRSFRREYCDIHISSWSEKRDDESRMDNLLRNTGLTELRRRAEYAVFDYYLAVRHAAAHPAATNDLRKLEVKRGACVASHESELRMRYGAIPNEFSQLVYDDYVLFARAVIDLADLISQRSRPSDAKLAAFADASPRLRRFSRPERVRSARIQRLSIFGLSTGDAAAIIEPDH